MAAVGIIAEFNPLHSGHALLISEARRFGTVVCAISGNFVQRGDIAIAEKRVRARAALLAGADVVLELPVCWSMSTAQNFALGGVSVLSGIGCDTLMFGSESGDTAELEYACKILKSAEYRERLSEYLQTGITFAAARERAAEELGQKPDLLSEPNNNLAAEYMLAADSLGAEMKFRTVKRRGAGHDSSEADGGFVSASLLREKLLSGDSDFCSGYIPKNAAALFCRENIADFSKIEAAVMAVLRSRTPEELKNLPDVSEGIENKLFSAIRLARDTKELYNIVKVKRYTHARIRRLALSAFIGMDNSFFMKPPPYIRVLGFSGTGEEFLKRNIPAASLPVIMRVSEIDNLSDAAKRLFATECRATDLYSLALPSVLPCGAEYTSKLIKTECC